MTITFFQKNCTFFVVRYVDHEKPDILLSLITYFYRKWVNRQFVTTQKKHLSCSTPIMVFGIQQPPSRDHITR
jgi:hypothetical protein